uniref:Uncharacterized protein n=1 Tax=Octopus bimaculoides TaxID=37653 RepID=A0A0L8I744_OCTBM
MSSSTEFYNVFRKLISLSRERKGKIPIKMHFHIRSKMASTIFYRVKSVLFFFFKDEFESSTKVQPFYVWTLCMNARNNFTKCFNKIFF